MSTETKQAWTPGPWLISERKGHECYGRDAIECLIHVGPRMGNAFASVHLGASGAISSRPEDVRANAHLISKAPEMAELLRDCRDVLGLAESNMFRGCQCPNNGSGDCESCLTEQQLRQQITEVSRLLADLEAK